VLPKSIQSSRKKLKMWIPCARMKEVTRVRNGEERRENGISGSVSFGDNEAGEERGREGLRLMVLDRHCHQ